MIAHSVVACRNWGVDQQTRPDGEPKVGTKTLPGAQTRVAEDTCKHTN